MRKLFSHGLLVFAGVVALPATVHPVEATPGDTRKHQEADPRLHLLKRFFQGKKCPAAGLSQQFLDEADTYKLDWRLLPSLSIIESGGGKVCHRHNMFGWDNGLASFPSFSAGLHHVAHTLGKAAQYRHKTLDKMLTTYNPNTMYARNVKAVMRSISPSPVPSVGL